MTRHFCYQQRLVLLCPWAGSCGCSQPEAHWQPDPEAHPHALPDPAGASNACELWCSDIVRFCCVSGAN